MPSPTDPTRALRRRTLATALVATIAVAACAAWAFRPAEIPGRTEAATLPGADGGSPPAATSRDLDLGAFEARLWNPVPAAPVAAPEKPVTSSRRESRSQLQLISLIDDGGVLSAAIYDAANDRLARVRVGETIAGYTVAALTREGVELTKGREQRHLALREDDSP